METLLKEFKRQIDFHFECDICFNRVTKCLLDCGHMMCKDCIAGMLIRKRTRVDIKCPYCAKVMTRELSWKPPVLADYNNLLESIEDFFRKAEEIGAEKKTSSTNDQPLVPSSSLSSSSSSSSSPSSADLSSSRMDISSDNTIKRDEADEVWMEKYLRCKQFLNLGAAAVSAESEWFEQQRQRYKRLSPRQQELIASLMATSLKEASLQRRPKSINPRLTKSTSLEPSLLSPPSSSSSSSSTTSFSSTSSSSSSSTTSSTSSSFPFKPKSIPAETSVRPKVHHIPPKKPSEPCAADLPSPLPRIVLPPPPPPLSPLPVASASAPSSAPIPPKSAIDLTPSSSSRTTPAAVALQPATLSQSSALQTNDSNAKTSELRAERFAVAIKEKTPMDQDKLAKRRAFFGISASNPPSPSDKQLARAERFATSSKRDAPTEPNSFLGRNLRFKTQNSLDSNAAPVSRPHQTAETSAVAGVNPLRYLQNLNFRRKAVTQVVDNTEVEGPIKLW